MGNINFSEMLEQCNKALYTIAPSSEDFIKSSEKTRTYYIKSSKSLVNSLSRNKESLLSHFSNLKNKNTFYKKISSLRYYCIFELKRICDEIRENRKIEMYSDHIDSLNKHLSLMIDFIEVLNLTPRNWEKIKSKRSAISGLPDNWRESLIRISAPSKYTNALITIMLTGCRPSELVNGVSLSLRHDPITKLDYVIFKIKGSKVKESQGQPFRYIEYEKNEIKEWLEYLNSETAESTDKSISITSAVNFTVEIRRLGKKLWPKHNSSLTAYCFRHQWASDIKKNCSPNAVSYGLGHLSNKTRRRYGSSNQSSNEKPYIPNAINAERRIIEKNILFEKNYSNTPSI